MSDITVSRTNWTCKCRVCDGPEPATGWAVRYRNAPVYALDGLKVGTQHAYVSIKDGVVETTMIFERASHFSTEDEAVAAAGEYILSTLLLNADVGPIQFEIV